KLSDGNNRLDAFSPDGTCKQRAAALGLPRRRDYMFRRAFRQKVAWRRRLPHRLALAALAALAVAAGALAGDGPAPPHAWLTIGRVPSNTRDQPFEHRINPDTVSRLAPKWVATTTSDVSGTPAVADGAVYLG